MQDRGSRPRPRGGNRNHPGGYTAKPIRAKGSEATGIGDAQSGTVTYRRCIRRRTLETLDLLPTLSELPGNERAMNVGVRVSLHEQDLDSGQDMFLDEITDLAETSGTCSVFVEKNVTGPVVLWMVRDLKLAQKFLLPFHAGKDSQLVPIAEWLAQNGR